LGAIHVGLVALHGPFDVGKFDAAELNAAVKARELELEFQLEVRRAAAAPDEKCVLRGLLFFGCLSDQRAFFDAPKSGIAIPARHRLTIEDRLEACFGKRRHAALCV
jgi:hypothetical protein